MKIMTDIETMSVHNSNALVLSVAVLHFDLLPGKPAIYHGSDSWVLDIGEQLLMGRRVDPGTQKFWGEQPAAAAAHWRDEPTPSTLPEFKQQFEGFMNGVTELWANGVVFDIGNLASFWDMPPWPYNVVRDCRTIYKLFPVRPDRPDKPASEFGVEHEPLTDCYVQVHGLWQRGMEGPFL